MRIDIMTLFPDTVGDMMNESILGRAQERGHIRIEAHQIRDWTANKQLQVDESLNDTLDIIKKEIKEYKHNS